MSIASVRRRPLALAHFVHRRRRPSLHVSGPGVAAQRSVDILQHRVLGLRVCPPRRCQQDLCRLCLLLQFSVPLPLLLLLLGLLPLPLL